MPDPAPARRVDHGTSSEPAERLLSEYLEEWTEGVAAPQESSTVENHAMVPRSRVIRRFCQWSRSLTVDRRRISRLPALAGLVCLVAVAASQPAHARSASVADLTLNAVTYSHAAQTSTGTLTLTAADSTGSNLGWNVTILSSAFQYSGAHGGTNIPAANFSLTSAAAPVATAGQAVDATGGPIVPTPGPLGSLDSARKTTQAKPGFGNGTYTQALGVSLTIPAMSRTGTYTATLTTTISAGP